MEEISNHKRFYVSREVSFFAAHHLDGRPIHIHKFEVVFNFMGYRKNFTQNYHRSLLINFYDIDNLWKKEILPKLVDNNKKIIIKNSSCENLADWIFNEMDSLKSLYENCYLYSVELNDGDVKVKVENESHNI